MCTLNGNKLKATAGHLHYLSIIRNTLNVHRRAYININTLFGILVPTQDGNTFPPLKYDQKAGTGYKSLIAKLRLVLLTRFSNLRVPNLLGNRLFICTFRQIAGLSHAELSNCGKVVLLIVGPLICSEDK